MAGKVNLKQLAQSGAVDGQVAVWSTALGQWVPTSVSGGAAIKSVEVDFGSVPCVYKHFTIVDASVSAASKIIATQSGHAATGGYPDDAEMDPILFSASPGTGQLTLSARTLDGPVINKYVVDYQIG